MWLFNRLAQDTFKSEGNNTDTLVDERVSDKLLEALRDIQHEISICESRVCKLETLDFPMLFGAIASVILSADRIPRRLINPNTTDKEHIQMVLSVIRDEMELSGKPLKNLDIERLCNEIQEFSETEERIALVQHQLDILKAKEHQVKESLKIV